MAQLSDSKHTVPSDLTVGGPSPQEFEYVDEAAFIDLINEMIADTCILAGDLKSTTLHPEGYPDPFRMFAFGIEPELDAKHSCALSRSKTAGLVDKLVIILNFQRK